MVIIIISLILVLNCGGTNHEYEGCMEEVDGSIFMFINMNCIYLLQDNTENKNTKLLCLAYLDTAVNGKEYCKENT